MRAHRVFRRWTIPTTSRWTRQAAPALRGAPQVRIVESVVGMRY
ncbi:MAG TPA: hypothetical protein VGQ45_02345 [Gaiellales bacterium]|nr:hypothetical protein [Gaiellales bacterium]